MTFPHGSIAFNIDEHRGEKTNSMPSPSARSCVISRGVSSWFDEPSDTVFWICSILVSVPVIRAHIGESSTRATFVFCESNFEVIDAIRLAYDRLLEV